MAIRNPDDQPIDREERVVTHEQGATQPVVPVVDPDLAAPANAYSERVTVDYAAERQAALNRAGQLIGFVFGLIVALIGIRVLLRLIAANPDNPFAQFIYGITGPLVAPFITLTGTPTFEGAALEIPSLIAMLIYALLGWALVKLLWLIFYRPSSRGVSTRAYHHD